ncbi:MAG TPA: hypothetical protein VMF68_14380 [Spirochaetia bacterium]|nr:hypothetical protein [Spirochaetia bacterium]
MSLEQLVDSLSTLGVAHEVRRSGADGALLVLPEFGRVFGIWPHFRAENALWVNPGFLNALQAGVKDDEWSAPGGDRVWLFPGSEFLSETGAAPAAVDPGRYTVTSDRALVIMTNRGEAYARQATARLRFRITRRLRPLDEPEIDAACGQTWLRRSGFQEELVLELDGPCPVPVSLWSIAQAPPGSEVSVCEGPSGEERLVCVQEGDSERARLLVKAGRAGEAASGYSMAPGVRAGGQHSRPVELALVSPAIAPGKRRQQIRWNVSLYAFSGRSAEVRQLASRLAGTPA